MVQFSDLVCAFLITNLLSKLFHAITQRVTDIGSQLRAQGI